MLGKRAELFACWRRWRRRLFPEPSGRSSSKQLWQHIDDRASRTL